MLNVFDFISPFTASVIHFANAMILVLFLEAVHDCFANISTWDAYTVTQKLDLD